MDLVCCNCHYEGDFCDFPDIIVCDCESTELEREQEQLLHELWDVGYNVVTCGECGVPLIHRT